MTLEEVVDDFIFSRVNLSCLTHVLDLFISNVYKFGDASN
jgi:hypothetical protein